MDLCLRDDVAVVVGGASGIGRAIATAFLAEGAARAVLDIAAPTAADDRSASFQADVADCAAVMRAANEVRCALRPRRSRRLRGRRRLGEVRLPVLETRSRPTGTACCASTSIGAANVAHAFAPELAEQQRGTMLFLASVAGQIGSQTDPPYSASKAGLINFAQCAAKDLAPFGVRVNACVPAW